ncbi:5'-methylthioadenosine/S-adenosylhomocysteine nucleosidase [Rhodovulum kholense]|nr:5'-methylthioadenosine/S-adenosylhomocysteine nucleosidase [Rhodovulum kholense]
MKASPIFLDFFNREAARASGRERSENIDIKILRTLSIALPHTFSINVSQLSEYCSTRPNLFNLTARLISAGIIDVTTQTNSIGEFIASRQILYSHVPERYPFFFEKSEQLESIKLGSRNSFDMSASLSQSLLAYDTGRFDFDMVRAHPNDRAAFESGLKAVQAKIFARENLAVTRELLESSRGGETLSPEQLDAASRIVSALYMKIYAEKRGLATCTGIPDFPYTEIASNFPSYDYLILRRTIEALGGFPLILDVGLDELAEFYGQREHKRFALFLQAFLEASAHFFKGHANQPDALQTIRALLDQFITRELDQSSQWSPVTLSDFASKSAERLLASGERVAKSNAKFCEKWREYVPEQQKKNIVITTATESERTGLLNALGESGFTRSRFVSTGDGMAEEYTRGHTERIVYLTTSAGSLGANSAGGVLSPAIRHLGTKYLISAGICFGLKPNVQGVGKQVLGDVVFSSHVQDYETARLGKEIKPRGDKLPSGQALLQAARIARDDTDRSNFRIDEGLFLSGQKLVDNNDFVHDLRVQFPEALAGEMEGNAVAVACHNAGVQWIVIKAICDWGMDKEDGWQEIAANRACRLALDTAIIILSSE